jgi:two-component system KDP operon response regulator KdpE
MTIDLTVLLVEDEPQIRRAIRSMLVSEGYRVCEAETGKRGLIEAGTRMPDILIVDLGLPDMDGAQLVREIRGWSEVPILILSARSDEDDKIAALDSGADDYLTKPFGVGELLARLRALARRRIKDASASARICFGDVQVDLARRVVTRAGADVRLTKIEYRLLSVLLANPGKVLTQRHLMQEVWGPAYADNSHYLRIYVSRLRQKLEANPTEPAHFLTEAGVGYRFEA